MLAARQRDALVAALPVEPELTAALAGPLAVALQRVAALLADRHVAQVALPAGQALGLALVVAHVVGVLALHCWQLACLGEEGSMVVVRAGVLNVNIYWKAFIESQRSNNVLNISCFS